MSDPGRLRFPEKLRHAVRESRTRFVVTGAGGWLGRATLEMLDDAVGDELADRVHAYAASARPYRMRSGRVIALSALPDLASLPRTETAPTVMAHYAFLTREKTSAMPADAYVDANRSVTRFVVENANRLEVSGTFSTSSGAVYRPDGGLESSLADNPYGALKREEEEAFAALAESIGAKSAICRVFNLSGPFLNKEYALGSILEDVLADRIIRLRARHPVFRSYAHVRDVVSVGFAAMLGVTDGPETPFDTAGDEVIEVGDLALRARSLLGRPDLDVERPGFANEPQDRYVGDGAIFSKLLAQAGGRLASLEDGIRDTAAYLAAIRGCTTTTDGELPLR